MVANPVFCSISWCFYATLLTLDLFDLKISSVDESEINQIMWNLSTNYINQLPITTIVQFLFGIFDEQIWFFLSLVYQWNKISKGVFCSIVLPLRNNSDILNININIYLNPWSELSPSYLGNCYCIHSSEFKYCSSTAKNVVQKFD